MHTRSTTIATNDGSIELGWLEHGRAPPEVKASALKRHVWQVKLLNLSHDLLTTTLPFVLSKVNRVSYGLLSADQVETPPGHFLDTS